MDISKEIVKFCGDVKFEDFYRIAANSVKTFGIKIIPDENWSKKNEEFFAKFFIYYYRFWFLSGFLLTFSITASTFSHVNDTAEFTQILPSFFTGWFNFYKGYLIYKYQDEIKEIMRNLRSSFPIFADDQEKYGVKKIIRELLWMKRVYATLYGLFLVSTFTPTWYKFFVYGKMTITNEIWIPFEIENGTTFMLFTVWLHWIATTFCICGFGTDFMLFSTVTLISLEFKILKNNFEDKINQKEDIKCLVLRHDGLIQLCNSLHSIFENYLFIYIAESSIIVSLMCFQLAYTGNFGMFVPYLFVTLNQVWLLCFFGQKLHDSSYSIFDGILESTWYEDLKLRKNIAFIIQRSQKPKIFSARGFEVITLNSFRGV